MATNSAQKQHLESVLSGGGASRGGARRPPGFVELFTPKLVTVLRDGYGFRDLRADFIAGLTVAIVALPLSMAIAIASGVGPERGLYTAIVGGFLVSALGGSRFQIGGPAGAFIVLVAATGMQYGLGGLLTATFMSGLILLAIGFLRLGTFIKFIPYPVTVGFTAGIAVIIFVSQIKELLGLTLVGPEPADVVHKLVVLGQSLASVSWQAVAIAGLSILIIALTRTYRPKWPGMLIAVIVTSLVASLLGLHVETIGTRFGGIPRSLPAPALPDLSPSMIMALLPAAISFALLGSIESLLSAVVADSMSGRRHRSNCELVAQGVANVASSVFGGVPVTGTIARTATNVRAGARGPIAGILHAATLLAFMVVAAPLASYIPLAALAGVLAVVSWTMAERHAFALLLRASWGDAVVVSATFLLTVFRDLTEGILVGFGLGTLLFLHRMAQSVAVDSPDAPTIDDRPDSEGRAARGRYGETDGIERDIVVCRISGAFFFGAAAGVGSALDEISAKPKAYVIDFSAVPFLDTTGAITIEAFVQRARQRGADVFVVGARPPVRHQLIVVGLTKPLVRYRATIADAVQAVHQRWAGGQSGEGEVAAAAGGGN